MPWCDIDYTAYACELDLYQIQWENIQQTLFNNTEAYLPFFRDFITVLLSSLHSTNKSLVIYPFSNGVVKRTLAQNSSLLAMTDTVFPLALPFFHAHMRRFCTITRVLLTGNSISWDGFTYQHYLYHFCPRLCRRKNFSKSKGPLSRKQYTAMKKLLINCRHIFKSYYCIIRHTLNFN